jgi:cell division septal protein FtsQ
MKKLLSFSIWTLITLALVFVALCFFTYFNITDIEVNGIESLSEEQVIQMCALDKSCNLFAFNTAKAKDRLCENHYVKDVSFKKILPQKLVINVNEYKVRGYIPYMNSYLYIDEEGRVLDSRSDMISQLPIVTGLSFDGFTLGEVLETDNPGTYEAVEELSKLFAKYELLGDVIKVDVSDTDNIHLYVNKLDVKFGDFDDANKKIVTLNEILKQVDTSVAGVLDLTTVNSNSSSTYKYLS